MSVVPRVRRRARWGIGCALVAGAGLAIAVAAGVALGPQALAGARHATRPYARIAPLLDPLRGSPTFGPPPPPGSPAAARVVATLERVERRTRTTRYQHRTAVDERRGDYRWDCSGMAAWVLERAAPRARRALGPGRPVARTFARTIARAPTDRGRGWRRVDRVADVRPGDVLAWQRPPAMRSANTGHVAFVMSAPVEVHAGIWAVRILDSTSLAHQDDTRRPGGTGTGRGTMTFAVDDAGRGEAYGWVGTRSLGYIETPIRFGRPL